MLKQTAGPAMRNTGGSATRSAYTSNYLNWVVFFGNAIRVNAEPLWLVISRQK